MVYIIIAEKKENTEDIMIRIKEISKSYGSLTTLSGVTCFLGSGQKVALIGSNGAGKSTLLKIIAGIEEPDDGKIEIASSVSVGYLPQEIGLVREETIENFLKKFVGINDVEDCSFNHKMKTILTGFGLRDVPLNKRINFLSGGQKSKILLTGILLKGVDVLLLDEPTNNLDLPALIWLEEFLINSRAACLIVSHDQKFLDKVVSKVFELNKETHEFSVYAGGYSDYLEIKMKEIRRQKELYHFQQEELERLRKSISSKKSWAMRGAKQTVSDKDKYCRGMRRDRAGKSAKNAKSIEKRIKQMDIVEKPKERPPLSISLRPQKSEGKHSIVLKNVVAGYKDGFRIGPINLEIPYASRVGIFGQNGAGKSTLLKTIAGDIKPLDGEIAIGPSLIIGNLMQGHENLVLKQTPLQFLSEKTKLSEQAIYNLLSKFFFEDRELKRPIQELSPGCCARLVLAFFVAISANILLLDEPTNHLDIEVNEALREVLSNYSGTVVVISHDRYFLEQINLTDVYVLENNKLFHQNSYRSYVEKAIFQSKRLLRLLKIE